MAEAAPTLPLPPPPIAKAIDTPDETGTLFCSRSSSRSRPPSEATGCSASKPIQRTRRRTARTRGTGPAGGWAGRTGQRRGEAGWGVPGAPSAGDLAREGDRAGEGKTLHGNRLMAVAGGTVRWAGGQACSHPVSERVTAPRAVWPEGQRKSPSTAQPGMPQAAQRLAAAPARPPIPRVRSSGLPVGGGQGGGPRAQACDRLVLQRVTAAEGGESRSRGARAARSAASPSSAEAGDACVHPIPQATGAARDQRERAGRRFAPQIAAPLKASGMEADTIARVLPGRGARESSPAILTAEGRPWGG